MKTVVSLDKKELLDLVSRLVSDGAEVQGESFNDFLSNHYNLKWDENNKEFNTYDVEELIRKIVKEFL